MESTDFSQHPKDPNYPDLSIFRFRQFPAEELAAGHNALTRSNLSRLPEWEALRRERYGLRRSGQTAFALSPWLIGRTEQVFGSPLMYPYGHWRSERAGSQLAAWWSWYPGKAYIRTPELADMMDGQPLPKQLLTELELVDGLFHRLMIWNAEHTSDFVLMGVTLRADTGRYDSASYTPLLRWGYNLRGTEVIEQTLVQAYVVDEIEAAQGGELGQISLLESADNWPAGPEPDEPLEQPTSLPWEEDRGRNITGIGALTIVAGLMYALLGIAGFLPFFFHIHQSP